MENNTTVEKSLITTSATKDTTTLTRSTATPTTTTTTTTTTTNATTTTATTTTTLPPPIYEKYTLKKKDSFIFRCRLFNASLLESLCIIKDNKTLFEIQFNDTLHLNNLLNLFEFQGSENSIRFKYNRSLDFDDQGNYSCAIHTKDNSYIVTDYHYLYVEGESVLSSTLLYK